MQIKKKTDIVITITKKDLLELNTYNGVVWYMNDGTTVKIQQKLKKLISGTCEGCGEEKIINKNKLCSECQVLKNKGDFVIMSPEDHKREK